MVGCRDALRGQTELRQAALVTAILNSKPEAKSELIELYRKQGVAAAAQIEECPTTPEEMYKAVNDVVLEGMPCDRADQLVFNDEKELVWRTTVCLHKPYWDQVKGDVQHFYDLREGVSLMQRASHRRPLQLGH